MKYLLMLTLATAAMGSEKYDDYFKVTATIMDGSAGKKLATGKKNDADYRIFVALPSRKALGRLVRVFSPQTGKEVRNVPVSDVGPWSTNDNFFETGERPKAESGVSNIHKKVKNNAGIDLSLALCKELALPFPYKGVVYFKFEEKLIAEN